MAETRLARVLPRLARARLAVLILLAVAASVPGAGLAQNLPSTFLDRLATAAEEGDGGAHWDRWDRTADRARGVIDAGEASREAFELLRGDLETQKAEAQVVADEAAKEIARLKSETDALGPLPESGQDVSDDIAKLRQSLRGQMADVEAVQLRAQRVVTRAETLIADLNETAQRRFLERLTTLGPSPVNPANWATAFEAIGGLASRVARETGRAVESENDRTLLKERAPIALVAFVAAIVVGVGLRRFALSLFRRLAVRSERRGRRLIFGVAANIVRFLTIFIALIALMISLVSLDVFGPIGRAFLEGLGGGLFEFVLTYALAAAFFSPSSPEMRIVGFDDASARRAFRATLVIGGVLIWDSIVREIAQGGGLADGAREVFSFVAILVCALALWRLAMATRPPGEAAGEGLDAQAGALLRRLMIGVAVAAPLLALIGYDFAGRYLIFPFVRTLGVAALGYLLYRLSSESVEVYLAGSQAAADEAQGDDRLRLIPILLAFILICAGAPVVALLWGATAADLVHVYGVLSAGLVVGDVAISPMDFVTFALVFVVIFTVIRAAQRVLRTSVLPRTRLDSGASDAIISGVGYLGVVVAALAAIAATGLDLSNLAIVAGALTVGIGFGLQNIVNNFVSGLILLVERPIKVGDWIEVGGVHGYVRKVNVRSTEIQTFDRSSYILPNSDLISGAVTNFTHGDTVGRVIVSVGVAYGSDTRQVERLLLEAAREHPMVLTSPAPSAYFMAFGADALEFELRAYLRDVNWVLTVKSDINFAVDARFREAGIEVPYAQRDLHLRNPEALAAALRAGGSTPRSGEAGNDESGNGESQNIS